MTRRPAAALVALALAAAALLTGCGPSGGQSGTSAGSSAGKQDGGAADSAQVQDMQQKLDAAESVAAQADTDTAADNG
ncbi:hypothetical protein EH183_40400 [Streptomyces sp. CB01881]|uniref:hypothetical protein n=1 Tax=Streptomyces sp. CB01881 TaxID=2078691 RepID=UPI0011DFF104|nr:hypothetical protein [Streptomyces sp. CB01881]TYC68135.1 hypothetical protein EH183_40400 [Streptomyces sp. CB01881]